jgi:hypothetical protein
MIKFIRENTLASVLWAILISMVLFFLFFTEIVEYERTGRVIEHNVIGDKYGHNITYFTVVHFGNEIKSIEGLQYYVVPVGSTVTVTFKKLLIKL